MTSTVIDPVLASLHRVDPDHYLVHPAQGSAQEGWRPARDLAESTTWTEIGPAYGRNIDLTGARAGVIGASCALQGYAWRVATLSVGRWVVAGSGVRLAHSEPWVRLRNGRTVGLALTTTAAGPTTPAQIADDLVDHLGRIVAASRTVSRLKERVAWGNVASGVASAWRRVHDAAPSEQRADLREAARACLSAEAWPWENPPLTWGSCSRSALTYHRHTCCLIRLAPRKIECTGCSELTPDQTRMRWEDSLSTARIIPLPMSAGGAG